MRIATRIGFVCLILLGISLTGIDKSYSQAFTATWPLTANAIGTVTPGSGISARSQTFGPGLANTSYTVANGVAANGWPTNATISISFDYYEFAIRADSFVKITDLFFNGKVSNGTCDVQAYYSTKRFGNYTSIGPAFPQVSTAFGNSASSFQPIFLVPETGNDSLYFRLYAYNVGSNRYFYCKNFQLNGEVDRCSPRASNFSIESVSDVCAGADSALVRVRSSSMLTGNYLVRYNLSGFNTATNRTDTMRFTSGSPGLGTLKIPKELLGSGGTSANNTQITINQVANASNATCLATVNTSKPFTVGIFTPVEIFQTSGAGSVCPGSKNIYTINDGATATAFTWTLPGLWAVDSGAGTKQVKLTAGAFTGSNDTLRVRLRNACTSRDTFFVVTVKPLATLSTTSSKTRCSNVAGTYVAVSTPSGATFSWTRPVVSGISNSSKSGTGNSITDTLISTLTTAIKVPYSFTLTLNGCTSAATDTLTINPAPNTNTILSNQSVCFNALADTLRGTVSGGTGSFTYTWRSNTVSDSLAAAPASGSNAASTYFPGRLTQPTFFWRVATSGGCSLFSNPVQIIVDSKITSNTVSASQAICQGQAAAQLTGPIPTGGSGSLSYSWQRSQTDSVTGYSDLGATNQSYSPGALLQSSWFRRVVTVGNCKDTSNLVRIEVVTPNAFISPDTTSLCRGSVIRLSGSAAFVFNAQDFSDNAQGWTQTLGGGSPNSLNFGNPQSNDWVRYRSGETVNGLIFTTPDNSDFLMTQSKSAGQTTSATLFSPVLNTIGYSKCYIRLTFSFRYIISGDIGNVDVSTNNTNWTTVKLYTSSFGNNSTYVTDRIDISNFANSPTLYVRFRYNGSFGGWWAINSLSIEGGSSTPGSYVWTPAAGLFTNAQATTPYVSGALASEVFAKADSSTTYYIGSSSGCRSDNTARITITPAAVITSQPMAKSICLGGNDTLNVSLDNASLLNPLQYQWYTRGENDTAWTALTNGAAYSGVASGSLRVLSPSVDLSTLRFKVIINTNGTCPIESTPVSLKMKNVWLGNTNTDWNTGSNWSDANVPDASGCQDIFILGSRPNNPRFAGTLFIKDLNVYPGALLNLGSGTLQLSGVINCSAGSLRGDSATLVMNGQSGAQSLSGAFFLSNVLKNLTISNPAGVNIAAAPANSLKLSGLVKFGAVNNATLRCNDNMVLLSDANNTAVVADMTNAGVNTGNSITGKVAVERYISSGRKWRFLSIPTNTTQSIRESWQENNTANQNSLPGYGTIITDNNITFLANGFDSQSPGGPSLKRYNPATATFTAIPSTFSAINQAGGYMVYIRGDRASLPATPAINNPTRLRTIGELKQGDQPAISVPAGVFYDIGNPFASPLEMANIQRTGGVQDAYYLWDPKLTGASGLGGYQSFSSSGVQGLYIVAPGGGSYPNDLVQAGQIQSGQAFFVRSASVPGTVTIKETSKSTSVRQVFRTMNALQLARVNLYAVSNNINTLADGAMAVYGEAYDNQVTSQDVVKLLNSGLNVSLKRENQFFAIEFRRSISSDDTLYISATGLRNQAYQWELQLQGLDTSGRTAFIYDAYLNTLTPVNLEGVTTVNFSVDGNAGASSADRFKIIFKQINALPVHIVSISAVRENKNTVAVTWKTENEFDMSHYQLEKSDNGVDFRAAANRQEPLNSTGSQLYKQKDENAASGIVFYRVKAVSLNGMIQYSGIARVGSVEKQKAVAVFPNPVVSGKMNVTFSNMPNGLFSLHLKNAAGQEVFNTTASPSSSSESFRFLLPTSLSPGVYSLHVEAASGEKYIIRVVLTGF